MWLTPPEITSSLGIFDLDPCSPLNRPWDTAKVHYTIDDDGLIMPWFGDVWLNPPYGRTIDLWMKKMADHRKGVALIFARTDTNFFHQYIFNTADSLLFLCGRINFYNSAGMKSRLNAGAPSVLIAYGENNVDRLNESGLKGKHIVINSTPMIVVGISPTWKMVVKIALNNLDGESCLERIYEVVELIAPDKIANNIFFKEKIRQTLQANFRRVGKGKYCIR